jgi:endoglucanase
VDRGKKADCTNGPSSSNKATDGAIQERGNNLANRPFEKILNFKIWLTFPLSLILFNIWGGVIPSLNLGSEINRRAVNASRQLGRGINLAGGLDAPREGEWGITLEESYLAAIKQAGFNSVVIPIRWSAHASNKAPYQIDPEFLGRIDWVVAQGLKNQLAVLIRPHHYGGGIFHSNPEDEMPRFYAIWEQIANHFKNQPNEKVFFEISNEPAYPFTASQWNQITSKVLAIIRESNPDRTVMVCPISGGNMGEFTQLEVPEDESNTIVRLYYFSPMEFTHQGANWIKGSEKWIGTKWIGTPAEKQAIMQDFDQAQAWAKEHHRILFLGEFGTLNTVDMNSRVRWTQFLVKQANQHGISWGYWEFCSVFGVFDLKKMQWNEPLLKALLGGKSHR